MSAIIKGINSGVICNNKEFVSIALKTRNKDESENLYLFPLPQLKDFMYALESGIASFTPQRKNDTHEMLHHAPALSREELQSAGELERVVAVSAAVKKRALK